MVAKEKQDEVVSMSRCMVAKEKQDEVMNMSWCKVAAHNRSLHVGFGRFTPQNQHQAGTTVTSKS
jgi:hypothetical protein